MSETPALQSQAGKENWNTKFGVILAVAGSAVGLGNFLRFPGTAVNSGGGAFMIPYIISFLLLGIPIVWCEWTMGRLGGRFGQNNGAGIIYAMWRRAPAKGIGALTILIPLVVYMYYVLLEALCLSYAVDFFRGSMTDMFQQAVANVAADDAAQKNAVVSASADYFAESFGLNENRAMLDGRMLWMVLTCFLVNFVIIYRGVTRGIETFCKFAMPLLILCAFIILVRAMTLPGISAGLGFMWNPDWQQLRDPEVWLRASGQIFFSLSVGFGLILCYSSYLRSNDDVTLTALSASSTNEFCEVVLGGLIVVPTAFLFFGADAAKGGTFSIGFETIPAIMHYMHGGWFFGGMWFGLLFLAGVTSSLSMLQPAIAFLEDGFGLARRASVTILALITTIGAVLVMYFSKNATALDFTDFSCSFLMIVAGLAQVIIFAWIIGSGRGIREANRGGDLQLPKFMSFVYRFVSPAFLIIVLGLWGYYEAPSYLRGMSPAFAGMKVVIEERFPEKQELEDFVGLTEYKATRAKDQARELQNKLVDKIQSLQRMPRSQRPDWLVNPPEDVAEKRAEAQTSANVARYSVVGIVILLILVIAAVDIACRGRIGKSIEEAEARGVGWET